MNRTHSWKLHLGISGSGEKTGNFAKVLQSLFLAEVNTLVSNVEGETNELGDRGEVMALSQEIIPDDTQWFADSDYGVEIVRVGIGRGAIQQGVQPGGVAKENEIINPLRNWTNILCLQDIDKGVGNGALDVAGRTKSERTGMVDPN